MHSAHHKHLSEAPPPTPHLQLLIQLCHAPLQHPPVLETTEEDVWGVGVKRTSTDSEEVVQVVGEEETCATAGVAAVRRTKLHTEEHPKQMFNAPCRQVTLRSSSSRAEQSLRRSCLCWTRTPFRQTT